jgi:UDPglucose 6-dehydrogenase
MNIAVIGTGYVGLVTGTCLAEVGHDVTCVDIDEAKIAGLREGKMPIYEPGLADLVHKNQTAERLQFTTKLADAKGSEAVFFALPTPSSDTGEANLDYVFSAATDLAELVGSYTVIINKSTVPVGTAGKVREIIAAKTDADFDVVSNPEFLREGLAVSDFMQGDRIVVGTSSARAREVMQAIYAPLTAAGMPLLLMDEASAEMTKYAANSFLATKISFINEVANLCELVGADIDKVREGIGTDQRIGHRFLYAGIGFGGSCFPKDVLALQQVATTHNYDFRMLDVILAVNASQKKVLVHKITARLGEDLTGKTFALWGLAFKADTDDIREAPALEIIRELQAKGAAIRAYDPEAMPNTKRLFPEGPGMTYVDDAEAALEGADALIVATEWKEFTNVSPQLIANKLSSKLVFDGRNIFSAKAMAKAGLQYVGIGRPVPKK